MAPGALSNHEALVALCLLRAGAWQIDDRREARSWRDVRAVALRCDQTSIYVATRRTFQAGQLLGWLDLSDRVPALQPGEVLTLTRPPAHEADRTPATVPAKAARRLKHQPVARGSACSETG